MSISPVSSSYGAQAMAGLQRRHPPGPPKEAMDAAAGALGLSEDELRKTLMGGSSLADVAKTKGVSTDDLTKTMVAALKANKPVDAPELSDGQLTQMVGNLIAGKRPQGPPPENPIAAEFVRQAQEREGQRQSGSLVDVRV